MIFHINSIESFSALFARARLRPERSFASRRLPGALSPEVFLSVRRALRPVGDASGLNTQG